MKEVLPPPPKNQPELPPPPTSRPKDGLDALIMSIAAAVLWTIVLLSQSTHVNLTTGFDLIVSILGLTCWFTAIVWGLMSWKTRFGPTALLVCIVQILLGAVSG